MKAVVKTAPGPGNLAYMDFPDPEVRPGEVVIEVKAAGICGTDMSLYAWAESMVREYRPEPPLVTVGPCSVSYWQRLMPELPPPVRRTATHRTPWATHRWVVQAARLGRRARGSSPGH